MKCVFMHKKISIAEIELDSATGIVQKIGTLYAPEHLPIGIKMKDGVIDRTSFNDWWIDRSIPASRSGIQEVLEELQVPSTGSLLTKCYGLSLSDQYWICPEGSGLCWEDINFFSNDFSDDIGNVLFRENKKKNALNLNSPDNTSDGNLKKRWKIVNGERYLIKGGSSPFRQQPFNEVIADKIMQKLGIPHVHYEVIWNKGAPYSICKDFIDETIELIPAWRILQYQKQSNSISKYRHLVNCCELLGIKDVVPFLDRMIVLDYIIANEDRHFNNFGAIRNAETLEWIGMAPIYDSGSSLGYNRMPVQMHSEKDLQCKPFKSHYADQLKLVSSFDWIDFSALSDVSDIISSVLSCEEAADYIDARRIQAIITGVEQRISVLQQLANAKTHVRADSSEDDIKKDVAAEYTERF